MCYFLIETISLDYGGAGLLEEDLAYGGIDPYDPYDPFNQDPYYPDYPPDIPPYFPEGKTKTFLPSALSVVVIKSVLSVCLLSQEYTSSGPG